MLNRFVLVLVTSGVAVFAQSPEVSIEMPKPAPFVGRILAPFHLEKRIVSPPKLTNSQRLELLVRAGNLYLSKEDVIALVLENNLDIAVQRYGPLLAREVLRRTEGGGILRQVDTPVVAGPTSVSTAGISTNANGLAGGTGIGGGGGIVTQIGPSPPSLDPYIFTSATFGHTTTPLTNTLLNQTTALTNSYRQFVVQYGQQFATGTGAYVTFATNRSLLNSSTPLFNPSISGYFDIVIDQPLLQGLSIGVNKRDIQVARNNIKVSNLLLELQVATTVSAVLNLYWDLVSFNEAVRIKQKSLETAQQLYEGNKKQVAIGALAGIEVTRAAAEVSVTKEDLLIAQTNVAQQEIVLKNALSRNGIENTWLDEVHIIPLDSIEVPKEEEVTPIQDLVQEALKNRLEITRNRINLASQKELIKGDKNGLLPSLQAFVEFTNHGLAGPANPLYNNCCGDPNSYFFGGTGTAVAQLFRRNFPDYSAGFSLNIPFRNRAQQADYVTDQLQLRQTELQLQRAVNQVRVDVKTALIGLQQARSRYETAVATQQLAEQSLDAEQKRFQSGVSSVALVIQAQKDVATAEDGVVQAMANYTHAKIFFDQALGRTLQVNHISMRGGGRGAGAAALRDSGGCEVRSKAGLVFAALMAVTCLGQDQPYSVQKPSVFVPLRSYAAPTVPPIRLTNSSRLSSLIRAGKLYLSLQDALALAIENNLNLEIARYGPLLAESALERNKAGGPIRGVPSASQQVSSVNSGVGVNGSAAAAGLGGGGGGGVGSGGGNATIQQVGAITPNLDPVLQSTVTFSHLTQPQPNTLQSQTTALIDSSRARSTVLQQGLLIGGQVQFRDYDQHLWENSPSNLLNPVSAPRMDLMIRQNFLQSFGTSLNNRGIRIAAINTVASRESFRSQLLDLVVSVTNLYWDVVGSTDEVKLRQHALEITTKFRDDTKYEISIGAIAGFQLARAEADLASRRQDVVIAQAALRQRSTLLKEALSHTEDPLLEAAEIVPLDRIEVPATEDLPPVRELLTQALAKRPDVAVTKFREQTDEINLAGTTNPLLPRLQANFQTYNRGVAGTPQASGGQANPYFEGGYGTALGQIFRRNFPNNILSVSFSAALGNRQAQGDYGIDQLQYRQSQVKNQKDQNQILVDISSQVNALRQARARYSAATETVRLQEQLLAAEQRKSYGSETFNYIMVDQRALIAAQLSELNSRTSYARARVALDQVLGETLEKNGVTLEEGLSGHVARESQPPEISKK